MSDQIAVPFVIPAGSRTTRPAPGAGLLARCAAWLRRVNDNSSLHEVEPRLARDMGVKSACSGRPESFAVDPGPSGASA